MITSTAADRASCNVAARREFAARSSMCVLQRLEVEEGRGFCEGRLLRSQDECARTPLPLSFQPIKGPFIGAAGGRPFLRQVGIRWLASCSCVGSQRVPSQCQRAKLVCLFKLPNGRLSAGIGQTGATCSLLSAYERQAAGQPHDIMFQKSACRPVARRQAQHEAVLQSHSRCVQWQQTACCVCLPAHLLGVLAFSKLLGLVACVSPVQ